MRKKAVSLKKKTYHQGSEKKMQGAKERYYRDPEPLRQYWIKEISGKSWKRKRIWKKEISGKS